MTAPKPVTASGDEVTQPALAEASAAGGLSATEDVLLEAIIDPTGSSPYAVEADGLLLSGRTAGPERDPRGLVIALHGGTYTSRYYDLPGNRSSSTLRNFAGFGYRVVALDRLGYGAAAGVSDDRCGFDAQARTLARAVERVSRDLGPELPVLLLGHSIGGMLALAIAAQGVDVPLAGVMASGAGPTYAPGVRENLASGDGDSNVVEIPNELRDLLMFRAGNVDPVVHALARDDSYPMPKAELLGVLEWPTRMAEIAARVEVPVLWVLPEHDGLWASDADAQATALRLLTGPGGAQVVVQRGAGHCVDLHHAGYAHHLATAAFFEDCVLSGAGWCP